MFYRSDRVLAQTIKAEAAYTMSDENMGKKIVLLTLFLVFLLFARVMTASATTRIVGVSVGDWFKYGDITVNWSSNDPSATFPEMYKELNKTKWVVAIVTAISGTNITGQLTTHYVNGTETTFGGWVDIDTGNGENLTIALISANLVAGDTIYTSADSTMMVNETIPRTYLSGVRETNHMNNTWTTSQWQGDYYFSMNFYWDRLTGVFVEMSVQSRNQTAAYTTTFSARMAITESNVWVVPEFPTWTSILVLFVVLTFTIAVYKRRQTKIPI